MEQDTQLQVQGDPEPVRDPHRSLHSETGARPGEHPGRSGNPLIKVAGLAWLMDENGEDIPLYQASLDLYRDLDDRAGMATALRGWGATLVNQGEHARALWAAKGKQAFDDG